MSSDRDTKKAIRWDSGNRDHKESVKIDGPDYFMSYACISCKTAHKRHVEGDRSEYPILMECPICKSNMYHVGRNFKAPKRSDTSQWKKVQFLIMHGFLFQKIRLDVNGESVPYPETLEQAKEFVIKYKDWAYKGAL